jgi:uncharacterized protein
MGLAAFGAASGTVCGTALYARSEPEWFDISHTPVFLPKLRTKFRALHLADLHSSPSVPTRLLLHATAAGLREKPDAVFLTGDYISYFGSFDRKGLGRVFRMLSDAAPAFAVMGNHDCRRDDPARSTRLLRELLAENGVRVLLNDAAGITLRTGAQIQVAGTGDCWNRMEYRPYRAFLEVDPDQPSILLAHNPDTKDDVIHQPWDVMLSGHTHGGQVVLPGIRPYWAPVRDQRFISGLYGWRGRQLYITRGVGSPRGIRFRCRPEISVLDFQPPQV